jgi:hypothetical protein
MDKKEGSTFLFGLNDRKFLVSTQKEKSKTFEYDEDYSEKEYNSSSDDEIKSPEKKLEDYFGLDYFQSLEVSNKSRKRELDENDTDPFSEIYNKKEQKTFKNGTFEGILGSFSKNQNSQEETETRESEIIKDKIKDFLIKKIRAKYCCIFCNTKNEVNFRNGRYSECKACESRKQLYRRSLKLKSEGNSLQIQGDTKTILLCHSCYLENKPCEICIKIQNHVYSKKLNSSKTYLCLNYSSPQFMHMHFNSLMKNWFQIFVIKNFNSSLVDIRSY